MQVNFTNVQRTNSRVVVSAQSAVAGQAQGPVQLQVATPSTGATFLRRVANSVTFGWYTKHVSNPAQWRAFRNAVAADLQRNDPGMPRDEAEGTAQRLLSVYNPHKRLTAAKINNALMDLERLKAGESPWAKDPQRANASQSAVARAINTLRERGRSLNAQEQGLRAHAQEVQKANPLPEPSADRLISMEGDWEAVEQDANRASGASAGSVVSEPAQEQQLAQIHEKHDAAQAILNILRPGREIGEMALEKGMAALSKYAQAKSVSFEHVPQMTYQAKASDRVNEAVAQLATLNPKPQLMAIPFGLLAPAHSFRENHSVLIALDTRHQKVLYLDAKGHSMDHAMKNYPNANDLAMQLERLGKTAFGNGWDAATGTLQLTQAKQQGANDCVAFTHDFTRRLIDGQSVGDIERTMTAADREEVRLGMAQDIRQQLLA